MMMRLSNVTITICVILCIVLRPCVVLGSRIPFSSQPPAPFSQSTLSYITYHPNSLSCPDRYIDIHSSSYSSCDGSFEIHTGTFDDAKKANSPAWGYFSDEIDKNGWAFIQLETNEIIDDHIQAYAVGYLEGALSVEKLDHFSFNLGNSTVSDKIQGFLDANNQYMTNMTASQPDSEFWWQVSISRHQLAGIADGYGKYMNAVSMVSLNRQDIQLLNMNGDLDSLNCWDSESGCEYPSQPQPKVGLPNHCTAYVKWTEDRKDLFTAHVSWDGYSFMIRLYKNIVLNVHRGPIQSGVRPPKIPGFRSQFSSYPGLLVSTDEFVQSSTGLVSVATEMGQFPNHELYKKITPAGVLEFFRNLVANRLGDTGNEWCSIFATNPSWTYSNQWLIVDYKLFTPGMDKLLSGTIWKSEQIPGFIKNADVTDELNANRYVPSYNTPTFKDVFDMVGWQPYIDQQGSFWSMLHTQRAEIFRRDHVKVKDMESAQALIRYNDFMNDPISRCNCTPPYSAMHAIASRGDLNTGTYPFSTIAGACFGGFDSKVVNAALVAEWRHSAVSGPTNDNVPTFSWTNSPVCSKNGTLHKGQPDRWDFPWITIDFKRWN